MMNNFGNLGPVGGLIFIFYSAFLILAGLLTFFAGEIYIAIKEIAINTRKEEKAGNDYQNLDRAALLCKIMGIIIIALGAIAGLSGLLFMVIGRKGF